jgi:ribonuclease Z
MGEEFSVTFLGTGSAEPNKYRGSSAIHLVAGGGGGFLLDAGEGTAGAMNRQYGADNRKHHNKHIIKTS